MNTHLPFRTLALLIALLLAASMSVLGSAQVGTPPVNHEAHHPATPTIAATVTMPFSGTPPANMPGGTPAMDLMTEMGEFDLMFIDMMTLHHQGAVAMAEIALERGEHPELVEMAEQIIAAQNDEITQLQAWRDAWFPDAPQMPVDEMMGGMMGMMGGMQGMGGMMEMMPMMGMMDPAVAADSLRAAPEPFDLAFINGMIPHHLSALMMTEMAVQHATHPELTALAQEMITMQEEEIAIMREWRTDWYGPATPAS